MFFRQVVLRERTPLALFSMKLFQTRHKVMVTPTTIHEVFNKFLWKDDRLLRQSNAGAGSTRILVLNKRQQVKAVYLPMLCLPHPTTVSGDRTVLGLGLQDYLNAVTAAMERKQTTFTALSYPRGFAFTVFDTTGERKMPLVTEEYAHLATDANIAKGIGQHALLTAGGATRSRAIQFVKAVNQHQDLVCQCESFYMINRERGSCLMLGDVKRLHKELDPEEEVVTGMEDKEEPLDPSLFTPFADESRWISIPEQSLRHSLEEPLFDKKVPTMEGLQYAVSTGMLLLDYKPKDKPAGESPAVEARGEPSASVGGEATPATPPASETTEKRE